MISEYIWMLDIITMSVYFIQSTMDTHKKATKGVLGWHDFISTSKQTLWTWQLLIVVQLLKHLFKKQLPTIK